ncbi:hypothetical protein ABRD05_16590 [Bacillus velezensis]
MASDKEWVKISELSEEEKQSLTAGTAVLLHDNYYNRSSEKASLIRKKVLKEDLKTSITN